MSADIDKLITLASPQSPISEAYRALRTNIQFASFDRPMRTIAFTSTGPGEGKTTTIANLAVAFAQGGHKVILIDTDLRRPSLHKLFGVSNDAGLTSMFIDAPSQEPSLLLKETPVPNLRLLVSGPLPPNPSELLGSEKMRKLVERLRGEADYVLFDCPPILAVTDAAILGHQVDGVVLVLSANHTGRDNAAKAKALLQKVNANILGVVLNNVKLDQGMYQYYGER